MAPVTRAVDLSRRSPRARDLIVLAAQRYAEANRVQGLAQTIDCRIPGARAERRRLTRAARSHLLTAAAEVRLAAACSRLDERYLHALSIQQVQQAEHEVRRLVAGDAPEAWARLAVETHQRLQEQQARIRTEGS